MRCRSILISTLLILSLTACKTKTKSLDLFLYDSNDAFISVMSDNLIETLGNEYSIRSYDAKRSQSIQNNQIISALEREKTDVLLVNMVDRLSSSAIIQKANKTKTPVIFFNREPVYSDIIKYPNAYYVGTNPNQEGKNQGIMAEALLKDPKHLNEAIDKNKDGKLQCVFIQGEANHQDTTKRTYSCIEYLQNKGYELEILGMNNGDWSRTMGHDAMSSLYTSYGDSIEFVFSNNDEMALGAIDYLKDENIIQYKGSKAIMPFPIVGVDGTSSGLEAIKSGYLYGTTINDSNEQVRAISMLLKLLKDEITVEDIKKEFNFGEKEHYIYVSGSLVSQDSINKLQ